MKLCCIDEVLLSLTFNDAASGVVRVQGGGAIALPPLNFSQSEHFFLVRKFSYKNIQFGAENPHFGEI